MERAATRDSTSWRELLKLADGPSERLLLEGLLEAFCEEAGVGRAALYLEADGGMVREVAVGGGEFPSNLADDPGELERLELPRARLLHPPPPDGRELPGPLLVSLAAAVRAFRLEKQLKLRHFEVAYRGVELEALYDVGLAIASTLELQELYEEILLRAVSLLDARRGALYLIDGDTYELYRTFGGAAREEVASDEEPVRKMLAGEAPPAGQDLLPGARHLMAVPIEVEGKARGMLVVGEKESRHGVGPFPGNDRRTLSLFANQAAIALENARLHRQALEKERLERELDLAAEIQRGLLPKRTPELEGFELTGWSRPARHVGGDFYDLLPLGDGALGLVVADVSGKGMPAALLVSTLHSALHLLLDRVGAGADLLARLNRHIVESSASNRFITFILAEVRRGDGTLHYLNAGHNPGLLLRGDGAVEELEAGGLPLGMLPGSSYRAQEARLDPGDLVCLYSDGITECAAPDDEEFGCERLVDLLLEHRDRPLKGIVAAVDAATRRFAAGAPQGDDQTVVLLRRR